MMQIFCSDDKYMQFQVDGNLQYKCATCRGECYQVSVLEDAVHELCWRSDEADRDLIASLRAAAGLPTQDEIFSISPYSDDKESGPIVKNEYGRSLKFSLKGEAHQSFEGQSDPPLFGYNRDDDKNDDILSHRSGEPFSSPVAGSLSEGICSINQAGVLKHKFIDYVTVGNASSKSRLGNIKRIVNLTAWLCFSKLWQRQTFKKHVEVGFAENC
ncbi:hypothetical protein RHGRI_034035 [Rhododendron griersonianum]|uniref:Uncharacterized protein n=1 Tax=Rhododendron griersonianum TaxID=479676 RepID=A0AAV6I4M2_9ERIC|nr:hypothetical protein RHGRI_034035 [Rhododendron griersonianum]